MPDKHIPGCLKISLVHSRPGVPYSMEAGRTLSKMEQVGSDSYCDVVTADGIRTLRHIPLTPGN